MKLKIATFVHRLKHWQIFLIVWPGNTFTHLFFGFIAMLFVALLQTALLCKCTDIYYDELDKGLPAWPMVDSQSSSSVS